MRIPQWEKQPTKNQQQQNHHLKTDNLHAFYWYQIFALDSVVVEAQKMLSSHGGFLTISCTIIDKQSNHDSQIVRAKESLKLSHVEPSYSQASGTNPPIKALHQSRH